MGSTRGEGVAQADSAPTVKTGGKSSGKVIRDRTIIAALIGGLATFGAAIVPRLMSDGTQAVGSTPAATTTVVTTTTSGDDPTALLMSLLPPKAVNCEPRPVRGTVVGRVICEAESPSASVDLVFDLYDDPMSMRLGYRSLVPAKVVFTERRCPDGPDRSNYTDADDQSVGSLACWTADDGTATIVWTRDDSRVVAILTGRGGAPLSAVWQLWLSMPIAGS
jgi:hypothetical protein